MLGIGWVGVDRVTGCGCAAAEACGDGERFEIVGAAAFGASDLSGRIATTLSAPLGGVGCGVYVGAVDVAAN